VEKAKALELAELYKSPRFREIERLERYLDGSVYEGRPNFFVDDGSPLIERKPCAKYLIGKIAIRSHADMVLGEGKWPRIKIRASKRYTLSDDQVEAYETFLGCLVDQAELRARLRDQLETSMGARAAVIVGHVKRGQLGVQVFSAKACTLEQDADGCPAKLVIEYPYLEEYQQEIDRKWTWRCMLYRREVTKDYDRVFVPVEATSDGSAKPTAVDKKKSNDHKLGFCPVEWYAFLPPGGHDDGLCGRALHEHLLSELDVLNIGLSQRTRAAHIAGDPQLYETGVAKNERPAPTGRGISQAILDEKGNAYGGLGGALSGGGTSRKRGVGYVWTYNDANARLDQVTLPGEALKAVDEHIQDLARKIGRDMSYVELDPEKAHSGQKSSGRALEILLKPQLDFDGRIREDFGEHGIVAVLSLMVRIAFAANRQKPGGVWLDGLDELMGVIEGFEHQIEGEEGKQWMPPALDLEWGPFFVDTSAETLKDKVDGLTAANQGEILSKRTATASISHAVGIDDVDEELEQIALEKAQRAAQGPQPGQPIDPAIEAEAKKHEANGQPELAKALRDGAQKPPATNAKGTAPGSDAQPPKAGVAAPKDPGGVGSAEVAEGLNAAASKPEGMAAAQAHTPTVAPDAHLRGSSSAGVAETVFSLLKEDYPEDAIQWIRSANVEGPRLVPLEQIDFTNQENWSATHDKNLEPYVQKISDGTMKPIVLVNEPNDNKFMIIDGHHRALSYQQLGQPVMAYIVHTGTIGGPWDAMHSSQKNGNGEPMLTSQQRT
jgi:ParB-like nuclease domain